MPVGRPTTSLGMANPRTTDGNSLFPLEISGTVPRRRTADLDFSE